MLPEGRSLRFLCLAYGAEKDWVDLPEGRREELLTQDEVLRQRGDLVAAVGEPTWCTSCASWSATGQAADPPSQPEM